MTQTPAPEPAGSRLDPKVVTELVRRHGMTKVGQRPSLMGYLRWMWRRRVFIWTLSAAKAYSRYENNYLGQLWTVLNPLLLAGAYFLVFGLLLGTDDGTTNFIAFLTIGIFIFVFISSSLTSGARSVSDNQKLMRALKFPRAALPLSVTLSEIMLLLPTLAVLVVIVLLTGETPALKWLLTVPAVLLLFGFCAGAVMLLARIGSESRDVINLVPLGIRLARYVSGVFFSIEAYADGVVGSILQYQPIAVYLSLIRSCLLEEQAQDPVLWAFGAGWSVVFLGAGLVLFWRAEGRYGSR